MLVLAIVSSFTMNMKFNFNFGKKAPTPAPVKSTPSKKTSTPLKPEPVKKVTAKPQPVKAKSVPTKTVPTKTVSTKTVPTKAKAAPPAASSSFAFGLVGADLEAGEFDPLELSKGRSEETINWYRAAELKHSRICMLAFLGLIVQQGLHLPDPVFQSTLGYGAVTKLYAERPEAVWQILGALAVIETVTLFKNGQGSAGDLGWDPVDMKKLYKLDEGDNFDKMKLRELKNGRLAMLGTSAILLQEYVSGKGVFGLPA